MKTALWARAGAARLAGWWAGIAGLLMATGGGCPCCGAPACPTGLGVATLLGALGAGLMASLRRRVGRDGMVSS